MTRYRFILLTLLTLSMGGCLPQGWTRISVEYSDQLTPIQSERHYGEIFAYVSINGNRPLRMLVDTGAPVHSIVEQAAAEIGLEPSGTLYLGDYAGSYQDQPTASVESMLLGGLALSDFDIVIVPDKGDDRVDGVLGMLGLRERTLTLDFVSGEMTISDTRLSRDNPGVVPFRTTHDKKILIPMRLEDRRGIVHEYWATLDTGHNSDLLLGPVATLACLDRSELAYRAQAVGVHGLQWDAEYYPTYGPARVGNILYEGIVAGANQASNNIGVGLLEGCRVTIDWVSKLVRIQRLDGATRLIACESLGFFGLYADRDRYWAAVIPGSIPEQEGLTHHDSIIRMNGDPVDERFDMTDLWPIPDGVGVVEIEYIDAETSETKRTIIPIK